MQIFIRTWTGKSIPLDVSPRETIHSINIMIQDQEGIPLDQQRLCFEAERLDGGRTLKHYDIKKEYTLDLSLEQTGMISTITSNDTSDPLVRFLMLTDDERDVAAIPRDELRARAKEENVEPFYTFVFNPGCSILCVEQCRHLCSFLDFMWTSTALDATSDRVDMRLTIDYDTFVQLLSCIDPVVSSTCQSSTLVRNLHKEYLKVPGNRGSGASKLALRMTCGPTNACINFHCDGGYATSTSQIALNCLSEYKGGRLCFFVSDAVHVLERPVGSITQHPPKVLHGVTALQEGTRKSLFIIDRYNGLGEGEVIEVHSDQVQLFLAQQVSRRPNANDMDTMPSCAVCCERAVDHVVVPCGHLCLCSVCESGVITSCPIFRSNFQLKQRVHVVAKRQRRGGS